MGNPLVAGRELTWEDVYDMRLVAMVSENLARELWHEPAAALGKRIRERKTRVARSGWRGRRTSATTASTSKVPAMSFWPFLTDDSKGMTSRPAGRCCT